MDPEYYKNLRWMLENNITDVLDLTFTEESDYFGKKEVVEVKPGGKDIRSAMLPSPLHLALGPNDTGGEGGQIAVGAWDCSSIFCHPASRAHATWCLGLLPTLFPTLLASCMCRRTAWQCRFRIFFLHTTCPVHAHAHANADLRQVVCRKKDTEDLHVHVQNILTWVPGASIRGEVASML